MTSLSIKVTVHTSAVNVVKLSVLNSVSHQVRVLNVSIVKHRTRKMITKIISGGQTGADQGGLLAGLFLGLTTGGWAERSWKTEDGTDRELLESYGLKPCAFPGYGPRTAKNVADSDGTVLFGMTDSVGSFKTQQCCLEQKKPILMLRWYSKHPTGWEIVSFKTRKDLMLEWIERCGIRTLNVAGNRESINLGIGAVVTEFLVEVLS